MHHTGTASHSVEIQVLKSTNDAATTKFLQGFTIYKNNNDFLAAAGPSEWCVGFESYGTDVEFETNTVLVQSDAGNPVGFQPFTIAQSPRATVSSGFANRIVAAKKHAVLFVNNAGGGGGEVKVDTAFTIPIASWRAEFQAIAIDTGVPSEGVNIRITLQTSAVTMTMSGIANGFFGFTVAPDTKVQKITFEGAVNVGTGGEAFEMDFICGSATKLTAPVPAPVQSPMQGPVQTPVQSPVRTPVQSPVRAPVRPPTADEECFAESIPLVGFLICLVLDIILSLGTMFV
jgi:hypothetical protein